MPRTLQERTKAIKLIEEWHSRAQHETEVAKSSADMRDFEVFRSVDSHALTVKDVAAALGITHQAIYKMLRRGRTFKQPPFPF